MSLKKEDGGSRLLKATILLKTFGLQATHTGDELVSSATKTIKQKMICRFCNCMDRTISHHDGNDTGVLALESSFRFLVEA